MKALVLDPLDVKQIIRDRREAGVDRFDEVWNGVYVVTPTRDNQHQELAGQLSFAIKQVIGQDQKVDLYLGVYVSDRREDWKKNYRLPDLALYLPGTPAVDCGTHWLGGPDFAVEVITPHDWTRKKLPFYAKVGVRELLLIDRKPWALELYRSQGKSLELVGKSTLGTSENLTSDVLSMKFRVLPGKPRPRIELTRTGGD